MERLVYGRTETRWYFAQAPYIYPQLANIPTWHFYHSLLGKRCLFCFGWRLIYILNRSFFFDWKAIAITIQIFFLLAVGAGLFLTLILAVHNGTIGTIQGIQNDGYLPQIQQPLRRFYTGILPVDHQLSSLTIFFWPIADAHLPSLTLLWVNLSGELVMSWTLIMIEGMRKGNRGGLISKWALYNLKPIKV